jgi:hypothetical protein
MDIDDDGSSAAEVDWESNPVLREIFEALCKTPASNIKIFAADPVQSKSDLTVEPFCLETSASGTRRFSSHDIHDKNGFLHDLVRKPDLAVVVGYTILSTTAP